VKIDDREAKARLLGGVLQLLREPEGLGRALGQGVLGVEGEEPDPAALEAIIAPSPSKPAPPKKRVAYSSNSVTFSLS
jgi:hypothetical protein